jgi:hypothetical protein
MHLEIITFSGIFRVKKLQKSRDQSRVDILSRYFSLCASRNNKTEEELVYNVKVRPSTLKDWLILFRIERGVTRSGWKWTKDVCGDLEKIQ